MKRSVEEISARRDEIFQELLQNKEVYVKDLADKHNTSELTIRRDLAFFEDKKYVQRFYGGARLMSMQDENSPSHHIEKLKHDMAKKAAQMIDSGDTIFINSSSTALLVLKYLGDKEVTVITNNAKAVFIKTGPNVSIILSGGELRNSKFSMVGDFAIETINKMSVSHCILGCSGFCIDSGLTTSIHSEVSINALMLKNTRGNRIILADHTKINQVSSYKTADISEVDILITDHELEDNLKKSLFDKKSFKTIIV